VTTTAFQTRVYAALRGVPRGRVTTYRHLAQAVGCGSCRAVGQALRRNPCAPETPCHRVIASDATAGGYCGARTGPRLERKLRLLAEEGVLFVKGRLADTARIMEAEDLCQGTDKRSRFKK
jgi:methylated-DNA-[protein]-cysteine S-methyltransferase